MPYCWLQLGLNAALFPFTGLCNGAGFEKPPPCRQQIQSCWYRHHRRAKAAPCKARLLLPNSWAGGLCASHCPPPNCVPPVVAHPNMSHFPTPWAGAVAWIVSESFVLSSTSVLSYLSFLLQVNSSVDWFLLLTVVSGTYSLLPWPHEVVPRFSQNVLRKEKGWFF